MLLLVGIKAIGMQPRYIVVRAGDTSTYRMAVYDGYGLADKDIAQQR